MPTVRRSWSYRCARIACLSIPLVMIAAPLRAGEPPLTAVPLGSEHARLGRWLADQPLRDLDGRELPLSERTGRRATVVTMRDAECPLCRRLGPELARLERTYADQGVRFLFVDPADTADPDLARADRARFDFRGDYVAGPAARRLAGHLGATTTTEVFVLDADRTIRYHGAVNDQYAIGAARPEAQHDYLAAALDALLAGHAITVGVTSAPGCLLALEPIEPAPGGITYHNRISRILDAHCVTCHHAGGPGPFALDSFGRVKRRRAMIGMVVEEGLMPPWHAAPGSGPWLNDRQLPAADRRAIAAWIENGAPAGDPDDAPERRPARDNGWQIGGGQPDAVFETPKEFTIPAEGVLNYKYAYVQTDFPEDRWIRALEIRPSSPAHVHHVLVFLETPGWADPEGRRGRRPQSGLRGYFAGLVPGQGPTRFAPGFGMRLPRGAWLKFQIHYTANGESGVDRPSIGFVFADEPPAREIVVSAVATTRISIPPESAGHEVQASRTFRRPTVLLGFSPHMHLRGAAFRYELVEADGTARTILDVPRYDFDWQTMYRLTQPIRVEPGAELRCTAVYDNTADNPDNPDPTARVGFGEQTWDEMMIGYFEWYDPESNLASGSGPPDGVPVRIPATDSAIPRE